MLRTRCTSASSWRIWGLTQQLIGHLLDSRLATFWETRDEALLLGLGLIRQDSRIIDQGDNCAYAWLSLLSIQNSVANLNFCSSCPPRPQVCDWNLYNGNQPNYYDVTGAIVGGPDANDVYEDSRQLWQHTEGKGFANFRI